MRLRRADLGRVRPPQLAASLYDLNGSTLFAALAFLEVCGSGGSFSQIVERSILRNNRATPPVVDAGGDEIDVLLDSIDA
jgi:hypothetical protein